MIMTVGQLRQQVMIETQSMGSPSASGERVLTWGPVQNKYTAIYPLSGKDIAFAQSFAPTCNYKIVVGYAPWLLGVDTNNYRVNYNGSFYVINHAFEGCLGDDASFGRRQWMTLLCTQYVNPQDIETNVPNNGNIVVSA